jgi:hypothetical protein
MLINYQGVQNLALKGELNVIAFAQDLAGYIFELIQRVKTPEPLCQASFMLMTLPNSTTLAKPNTTSS